MAFVLLKVGDKYNIPAKEYLCESSSDISELPEGHLGDHAIVADDNNLIVYWTEENGWSTPK